MDKLLLPNETPEKRLEYLNSAADQVVQQTYYTRLNDSELSAKRAEFTNNALAIDDLETQKKDAVEQFKEQIKPLKEIHKTLSQEVRTGFVEKEGKLFKFIDRKIKMVHYYDSNGELIKTEPASVAELAQGTIHMNLRTGTDN